MPSQKLTLAQVLDLAVSHHTAGHIAEAERLYRIILAARPDQFNALKLLATVEHQRGNNEDALRLIDKALAVNSTDAGGFNNRGSMLQGLGRLEEAVASYDQALAISPDFAEVHYNRALVLEKLDRGTDALASLDKAIAIRPAYTEALLARGKVLAALNQFDQALTSYDQLIAAVPDNAEAMCARGGVLIQLKRYEEALASFVGGGKRGALSPEALFGAGAALSELERFPEAVERFDQAIATRPDYVEAHFHRGNVLVKQMRLDEALASFDKVLALDPDYTDALGNRSVCEQLKARHEAAVAGFDRVLEKNPSAANALYGRGLSLESLNRWEEALESHAKALQVDASNPAARLALVVAQLPIFYRDEIELSERRAAFAAALQAWCREIDQTSDLAPLANMIGSRQPFYLPYQGWNDRDLLALYGARVCRIMAARYPPVPLSGPPLPGEPISIGIVSGFFYRHSNWKAPISGWLGQLDRRKFRLFGYHVGPDRDAVTRRAAGLCERFVQGPLPVKVWRQLIAADAPHVLIYPEIGMYPDTVQLAAQRLAPVQCNAWGHPETSGLPTLDFFLSSELMEPPDGEDHYTEQLGRLPNMSIYYELPDIPAASSSAPLPGIRPGATVYWSGQSLYKYLPQFDEVFCRIAREVGDCQFVFLEYQHGSLVTAQFKQRLDRAFSAFGLKAEDHCVVLPRLEQQQFIAAIGQCDVVLDTIGWSGFNSTLESLPHGLPVVTTAGELMRACHSAAILRMMGVTETIAETIDDYVRIAVRLARDEAFRLHVREKMALNKHRVLRERACIAGLEEFLVRAVREVPV